MWESINQDARAVNRSLRLRNPPPEAQTRRNGFPLSINRELVDGAAGTRTFVPSSERFITLPIPVTPFAYSSLCGQLLSSASGRCPCALYVATPQRGFLQVQAR